MFKNIYQTILLQPLKFLLLGLLITTSMRLGLSIYFFDRMADTAMFLAVLGWGFRIDLSILSMWLLLAMLLYLPLPWIRNKSVNVFFRNFITCFLCLGLILILFMEAVTPTFIAEFDVRPNQLFIEYLNSPNEVSQMLIHGFLGSVVLVLLAFALGSFVIYRVFFSQKSSTAEWSFKAKLISTAVIILLLPLLVLGARSGLQHRPINPSMVAVSHDRLVNSLPLNSFYSVCYVIYQNKHESDIVNRYGTMSIETAKQIIAADMDRETLSNINSTNSKLIPTASANNKDLLIIVLESHGAHFVPSLGGEPVSPNIENWRKKSWFFDNLYATGTRSARGLEAIVAGFPPTPAKSVLKLPKAQSNFTTIASILRAHGYDTSFIYGGESHFDNMKGFFLANGFNQVFDQYDFNNPKFSSSWGVSDEDLFDNVLEYLAKPTATQKFVLTFTSSNHPPFEYPAGKIEQYDADAKTALNSAKYADYALGNFLTQLEQTGLLEKMVILVIADHEDKVFGEKPVPYEKFRIPGFIIAADIANKIDKRMVSQIDMAPTLLSMLGIEAVIPMIGRDLTRDDEAIEQRAIMQFGDNAAYMTPAGICYLQPDKAPIYEAFNTNEITMTLCEKALAYEKWAVHTYETESYNAELNQ